MVHPTVESRVVYSRLGSTFCAPSSSKACASRERKNGTDEGRHGAKSGLNHQQGSLKEDAVLLEVLTNGSCDLTS